jgi:hypothetical protein
MPTTAHARPWIPARPPPPPLGYLVDGDRFIIPGIAVVTAHPHRRPQEARAFARRIVAEPSAYLDVPGVVDLRPISHARGGTPFGKAVAHG